MNASSLKIVVIREVLIVVLCVILGITGTTYAKCVGGEETKAATSLFKAQMELFRELDVKYQQELASTLEEIQNPKLDFDKVEVYNYEGKLLKTIDVSKMHEFNEQELVPRAHLLEIDNRVAVYIVF